MPEDWSFAQQMTETIGDLLLAEMNDPKATNFTPLALLVAQLVVLRSCLRAWEKVNPAPPLAEHVALKSAAEDSLGVLGVAMYPETSQQWGFAQRVVDRMANLVNAAMKKPLQLLAAELVVLRNSLLTLEEHVRPPAELVVMRLTTESSLRAMGLGTLLTTPGDAQASHL